MDVKTFSRVWGYRVRRQRLAQGMRLIDLAAHAGMTDRGLWALEHGKTFPRYTSACRIAEALGDTMLVDMIHARRWKDCVICGRRFLNLTDSDRKVICGLECKRRNQMAKTRGYEETHRENQLKRWRNQYERERKVAQAHQLAVIAMCKSCEPAGLCRDAGCALRPVSPFPVARKLSA
jgi:transcriptional regulator with XRE-family HTH domain